MISRTGIEMEFYKEVLDVAEIPPGVNDVSFIKCDIKSIVGFAPYMRFSDCNIGELKLPKPLGWPEQKLDIVYCVSFKDCVVGKLFSASKMTALDFTESTLTNVHIQSARGINIIHSNIQGHFELSSITAIESSDISCIRFVACEFYGAGIHNVTGLDKIPCSSARGLIPICPTEGSFVAWKKAVFYDTRNYVSNVLCECIVKLLIPEDALRSSSTTRKCLASKAKVLDIFSKTTGEKLKRAFALYDNNFVYEVGGEVSVPNFDPNRWRECAPGIHFYITEQEAREH